MPRMPEEKKRRLQELNKSFNNNECLSDLCKKFLARMAREKVSIASVQNLSWMGFYKAPFSHDFENADIVIAGTGADYGTLGETGDMRHAPVRLRHESRKRIPIHGEWDIVPFEMARIVDLGDIDLFGLTYGQQLDHMASWMTKIAEAGALFFNFGGEHSVSHASWEAMQVVLDTHFDGTPAGGILFDGHADLLTEAGMGGVTDEVRNNGNAFALAMAKGILDPDRFVLIGIHETGAGWLSGWGLAQELGIPIITALMMDEKGTAYWADFVSERVGDGPCVIECDLDGLDSAESGGGLSTLDDFGLTWREVRAMTRALKGKDVVSANIVEYSPAHDVTGTTAAMASHLGFEILCMMTETKVRLNGGEHKPTRWEHNFTTSAGFFGDDLL